MKLINKCIVFSFLLIIFTGLPVAAQVENKIFKKYPSTGLYKGKNAPVKLTKASRTFRTRLLEAGKMKPNFAGHYILATWGCGMECVMGAIIDANTGDVFQIPFTVCCWGSEVDEVFKPVDFRPDSKLIIFYGARDEKEGDLKKHYYLFENKHFIELPLEDPSDHSRRAK